MYNAEGWNDKYIIKFAGGISFINIIKLWQNYDNLWQLFHYFPAVIDCDFIIFRQGYHCDIITLGLGYHCDIIIFRQGYH